MPTNEVHLWSITLGKRTEIDQCLHVILKLVLLLTPLISNSESYLCWVCSVWIWNWLIWVWNWLIWVWNWLVLVWNSGIETIFGGAYM